MQIGETIKFELSLGRYVDGVIRSVSNDKGLVKLRVEYGRGSFATILSDEIVNVGKRTESKRRESHTDSDMYF